MSKVKLTQSTFQVCPEGEHFFKITEVKHDEDFQTITLTLKTPDGFTDTERYGLLNSDGTANEGACGAFSYMCRCAMQDNDMEEIEPKNLKDKYIKATVVHTKKPSTKKEGKEVTFTSLQDIESCDEEMWVAEYNERQAKKSGTTSAPTSNTTTAPKTAAGFDLDALFGKK
jgi:hypothetical protein